MLNRAMRYFSWFFVCGLGLSMWQITSPSGLNPQAWHLFIIFFSTIVGIILHPLPIGAMAMLGMATAVLTKTLTLPQVLGGFSSSITWLVVFAFMIARSFIKTGLGRRAAYYFISKLGRSTLGLSYGLVLTDLVLSPMIPSVAARGGGIIFPVAKSLSLEYDKQFECQVGSKARSVGGYIMSVCFQTNVVTSAMFMTSMAANPLTAQLAANMGVHISWSTWALGAIVPGLVTLALLPYFLFHIWPPCVKITEDAPAKAKALLQEMGPISRPEIISLMTFGLLVACWILDKRIGLDPTTTAMMGAVILVVSNVLSWNDIIQERGAWDTFIWFSILVMMSDYLSKLGMMSWFGLKIEHMLVGHGMVGLSIAILGVMYFYIHYIFASSTAHVTVLYSTFLLVLIKLGVPSLPAAMSLAFMSSLSACLTHFGTASAPVFFESNYLTVPQWWRVGFLTSIFLIIIWVISCGVWWKAIGWY